jgi:hypothetical protein
MGSCVWRRYGVLGLVVVVVLSGSSDSFLQGGEAVDEFLDIVNLLGPGGLIELEESGARGPDGEPIDVAREYPVSPTCATFFDLEEVVSGGVIMATYPVVPFVSTINSNIESEYEDSLKKLREFVYDNHCVILYEVKRSGVTSEHSWHSFRSINALTCQIYVDGWGSMPSSIGDPQFAFMITYFLDRITSQLYDPLNDVWREDIREAAGWSSSPMTRTARSADRDWGDGHTFPPGTHLPSPVAQTGNQCWDYSLNEQLPLRRGIGVTFVSVDRSGSRADAVLAHEVGHDLSLYHLWGAHDGTNAGRVPHGGTCWGNWFHLHMTLMVSRAEDEIEHTSGCGEDTASFTFTAHRHIEIGVEERERGLAEAERWVNGVYGAPSPGGPTPMEAVHRIISAGNDIDGFLNWAGNQASVIIDDGLAMVQSLINQLQDNRDDDLNILDELMSELMEIDGGGDAQFSVNTASGVLQQWEFDDFLGVYGEVFDVLDQLAVLTEQWEPGVSDEGDLLVGVIDHIADDMGLFVDGLGDELDVQVIEVGNVRSALLDVVSDVQEFIEGWEDSDPETVAVLENLLFDLEESEIELGVLVDCLDDVVCSGADVWDDGSEELMEAVGAMRLFVAWWILDSERAIVAIEDLLINADMTGMRGWVVLNDSVGVLESAVDVLSGFDDGLIGVVLDQLPFSVNEEILPVVLDVAEGVFFMTVEVEMEHELALGLHHHDWESWDGATDEDYHGTIHVREEDVTEVEKLIWGEDRKMIRTITGGL